jgi:hypothetical protein
MTTSYCLLIILLSSSVILSSAAFCPDQCRCVGTTVVCSDLGLRYVPRKIPATTEKLDLSKNNISHITLNNFVGLTKLKKLNLNHNRISSIHYRAFEDMTSLNILYLDHNEISCIQDKTFRPLKDIEILTLNNNNITTLSTVGKSCPGCMIFRCGLGTRCSNLSCLQKRGSGWMICDYGSNSAFSVWLIPRSY